MSVEMKIFYPEGKPDGEISIKKIGASGHAVAFPRELCGEVCRDDTHQIFKWPCVYILWNPGAQNKKPQVYIGESDTVSQRMTHHLQAEFCWTRGVIYTDANGDLNKTHALQIEAQMVKLAREAKVCDLQNTQMPRARSQNAANIAAAERYIDDLCRFFLPLAGCDFFRPHDDAISAQATQLATTEFMSYAAGEAPQNEGLLFLRKSIKGIDIEVQGRETDKGFLVYAGSQASKHEIPSYRQPDTGFKNQVAIRDDLIKQNILIDKGDVLCFSRNFVFSSPWYAATVILGGNYTASQMWKDADGRTLGELQQAQKT